MNQYTITCTFEQAKKALELGAPITTIKSIRTKDTVLSDDVIEFDKDTFTYVVPPTAEQMQEWLRSEKKIFVKICPYVSMYHEDEYDALLVNLCNGHVLTVQQGCNNTKEAIITAINVALQYLANNKK